MGLLMGQFITDSGVGVGGGGGEEPNFSIEPQSEIFIHRYRKVGV